jgi:hypothetical protein
VSEEVVYLVRYACAICGKEKEIKSRMENHGEVHYWDQCPDHPDSENRMICFCGDDQRRCAVKGCRVFVERHIAGPDPEGGYSIGLCVRHLDAVTSHPERNWQFSKHILLFEDVDEAVQYAGLPGTAN